MAKIAKNKRLGTRQQAPGRDLVDLSAFVENPDNPQTIGEAEFARLVRKVRFIPEGLRANSIAYVRDDPRFEGQMMVWSGNKRLRVLKRIAAEGGMKCGGAWLVTPEGKCPAEWFCDITHMTPEQRRQFLLDMNINEGAWDVDALMAQYSPEELNEAGLEAIAASVGNGIDSMIEFGDELGGDGDEGDDDGADEDGEKPGIVTLKLPPDLISAWRSYKRVVGIDRIVDFIRRELESFKNPQQQQQKQEETEYA